MSRVLIAGCGYVGAELAARLAADGHTVFGLRRHPEGLPAPIVPVAADLLDHASLTRALGALGGGPFDALVYAAAADRSSDEAYRAAYVDGLRNALEACGEPPKLVLFTSSTAVYAQQGGEWVDEESPTEPRHFNGLRMLEAERLLLGSGLRATALRLGGIYGPGRTRLVESVRSGRAQARRGHYTNRIHRDDAAGALRHLLGLAFAGKPLAPLYVGVDDDPADEATVVHWLADRLRAATGYEAPASEAAAGRGARSEPKASEVNSVAAAQQLNRPQADSTASSNKRCRNARLRAAGYRFRYPSFREGYGALLTSPGS